jgi:hypothetical protein
MWGAKSGRNVCVPHRSLREEPKIVDTLSAWDTGGSSEQYDEHQGDLERNAEAEQAFPEITAGSSFVSMGIFSRRRTARSVNGER